MPAWRRAAAAPRQWSTPRWFGLQPQLTQLLCNRRVKILVHCKCYKPRHDCNRELLSEDRFRDSRHKKPYSDVGDRPCQEAWLSYNFFRLTHQQRFDHQRWPAATGDNPLLIR